MADAASPDPKTHAGKDEWVHDLFGVDPARFGAVKASMQEIDRTPQPPPNVPPKLGPVEDFHRRAANTPLYRANGDAAANDMLRPEDRLTPAETRVGTSSTDQTHEGVLDEKGYTVKDTTTKTVTRLGEDGKPVESVRDSSATTNVGLGNATRIVGDKRTVTDGSGTVTIDRQRSAGIDLVKGEVATGRSTTVITQDSPTGPQTRTTERAGTTYGLTGVMRTAEHTEQAGKQLDSTVSTSGLSRTAGTLGFGATQTEKHGTMMGPPGQERMGKGTESTARGSGGLVSDDKGTGLGSSAATDTKTAHGNGITTGTTVTAGKRCQVIVKEIGATDPPKFSITTTISFSVGAGRSASGETGTKPGEVEEVLHKATGSASGSAGLSASASYKRVLTEAEAADYMDIVKKNGHGGKLPEHKILATGAAQGWDAAQHLWRQLTGSPEQARALKPGEELESNIEISAGGKLGGGGGETRFGGLATGVEAGVSLKHKLNLKKSRAPDGKIQITATVDDEKERTMGATAGMGLMGGKGSVSHGDTSGRAVVFMLDPNDPKFGQQLKEIEAVKTQDGLEQLASRLPVASSTEKSGDSEGDSAGASAATASLDLSGKGTFASEVTQDGQGRVTGAKFTGTSTSGGSIGVGSPVTGDVRLGHTSTDTYTGTVDKDGHGQGDLNRTTRSASLGKTLATAGGRLLDDPVGTVLNPGKLIAETISGEGTALGDAELAAICTAALDARKWNSQPVGHRQQEWAATGETLRAAVSAAGGDPARADKMAVQKALALWTKSKDGNPNDAIERIVRPFGAAPTGKHYAFPDGTDTLKPEWDALVAADPLAGPRAKLAAQPKEALDDMQAVRLRLKALQSALKGAAGKWAEAKTQHAEMLGHVADRMAEVVKQMREVAKALKAANSAGKPASAAARRADRSAAQAEDEAAALEEYDGNIGTLQGYYDAVWAKFNEAQAKLDEHGLFAARGSDKVMALSAMLKDAADEIEIWDKLYGRTYGLFEALSGGRTMNRQALERLHPKGARDRLKQLREAAINL